MKSYRRRPGRLLGVTLTNAFMWLLVIIVVYPIIWIFINSLKSNSELFLNSFGLPSKAMFSNYIDAWNQGLSSYFMNSIIVGAVSIFFTIALGSLCAYGIARFEFKGKNFIFYLILGGLLLSPQASLVPLFRMLDFLKLYNTYWALILTYIAYRLPFAVFLMHSYFLSFPKELEDSARIDGCGSFTTFTRIVLPISRPIVASVAIMTAIFVWNEFVFALVFVEDAKMYTIPVGLANFKDALNTNWTAILAGIIIASIPIIVLYMLLSKSFISGLTEGSVKG